MNPRAKKILLLLLAAALLFAGGRVQQSLNHDRDALGLTRSETLKNAPPMLAFTTVALGGFRGLISNYLWIRANNLQQDDKFFEAAQLANWITDLEPHFAQVWAFQAWNMAWNISVKFKENAPNNYADRWRWVQNGITLLRDQGLRYNPNSVLLYQQLAWIFQSKIGQSLDDGNMYYKRELAQEMEPFFGPNGTNFTALLHPQTAAEQTNALVLREKYKIDPAFAEKVNTEWGPLDWRLPEAYAIYWGARGLADAAKNPGHFKTDDLMMLRRIIYQSLLQAFHHGRLIANPFTHQYALGPNLDLIPQVNKAYLQMYAEEKNPGQKAGILHAHRNFLRDAIYFLYENDRMAEAQKWFNYLAQKYPDQPIIDGQPNSLPKNLTLDEYAVAVIQSDIGETSQERVTSAVQGLLLRAYVSLALGQEDRYVNLRALANRVYESYTSKTSRFHGNERIPLPPYTELNRAVLQQLLDPQTGLPFAARAVLRTQLGLPAENIAPLPATTNAPPPAASGNASPTNTVVQ